MVTPSVRQSFANDGLEVTTGTPEQLATFLKAEIEKWGRMVRESGARPE